MSNLKVGIVGAGRQAIDNLVPSIVSIFGCRIHSICDIQRSRSEFIESVFLTRAKVHNSLEAMMKEDPPDVLVAACPPQAHIDIVDRALEFRTPIFVEKPPCITIEQLQSFADKAESQGLICGVGMNFRYSKAIRLLKNLIDKAEFGTLKSVSIRYYCNKPTGTLWGLSPLRSYLLAQAIHPIDLLFYLSKSSAQMEVAFSLESPTFIQLTQQHENGVITTLNTGVCSPHLIFELECITSESTIIKLSSFGEMEILSPQCQAAFPATKRNWSGTWSQSPLESGYDHVG